MHPKLRKKMYALVALIVAGGTFCLVSVTTWTSLAKTHSASPAEPLRLTTIPQSIIQGEPVMINLLGTATTSNIKSAFIGESKIPLSFAIYNNHLVAFYGSDINGKMGTSTVTITLKNGTVLSTKFVTLPRLRYTAPLAVPDKLGGNSAANQARVVSILAIENSKLAVISSAGTSATSTFSIVSWKNSFAFPIHTPAIVTDPYGYNRDSGSQTITHKGTDFRAASGTPVYAIQAGTVRDAEAYTVYGNTVIIGHGANIESLYMHLSKISVKKGDKIALGTLIGYSGDTGYAEGEHLHISIKIGGVSIDPLKFFALFGLKPVK